VAFFNRPFAKKQVPANSGKHSQVPIYGWHQGRIFSNGGEQYAFEFNKSLPVVSVIGPATVAGCLMVTQLPQVFNPQSIPVAGLGGVQAGSLASQPLVNPDYTPVE
jgi:hypothetical protein